MGDGVKTHTLTPTLSRFAGEGAIQTRRPFSVPSPAERERDRVRVSHSLNVEEQDWRL
jgi:hypothetical protein